MKIGFNIKKIKDLINNSISSLETRVTALENNSEWVEITSTNGLEAEITQEFSEIRMLAKVGLHSNYVVTCNYDSEIFHNTVGNAPMYIICGNPTENNYGCKFKYMVTGQGNQYVSVDSCFEGGSATASTFRAWIKPKTSTP